MAFLEQIKNSTFAWIVLSLIAVASFVWAIYSHFTNNKKKRFSVASSSYEIIKEGKTVIPNLELFFCGKSIKNLTVSKFAIWNSGNKVINSDDLISTEKLQIYADEGEEILEAQIVGEVEPTNLFDVSTGKKEPPALLVGSLVCFSKKLRAKRVDNLPCSSCTKSSNRR